MALMDRKIAVGIAILIAVALLILYLLFPLGLVRYFTDKQLLIQFFREHRAFAASIFIGLQALQVVAAPIPGEVTGFVGGVVFGALLGIVYSTIGLTIGSLAAFSLARVAGRPIIEKVIQPETIKRYDYVMKHKGMFIAFLMFFMPGFPKDILCYILGLGHMRHREFFLVSTTGRLFGTTLLTVAGVFFRTKQYAAFSVVVGIGLSLVLLMMVYRDAMERWFRKLRAAHLYRQRADRNTRTKN